MVKARSYYSFKLKNNNKLFIVLLTSTFLNCNTYAQSQLEDFSHRRSVKQENQQMTFFVRDEDKSNPGSFSNDTWYYWFKSQKIMTTQGGADGLLLEGLFIAFYSNKQLSQKGHFKKGVKTRSWEYWRKDGSIDVEEKWRNGKLIYKGIYDLNSQRNKTIKKRFSKTKIISKDSVAVYKNDALEKLKIYNSNNNLISISKYNHGVLNGDYKIYENGKLISKSKYKNGIVVPSKEDCKTDKKKETSRFIAFFNNLFKKKDKEEGFESKKKENK